MTVSGVCSTRSMRSGLSANAPPLSRVTVIIGQSLDPVRLCCPCSIAASRASIGMPPRAMKGSDRPAAEDPTSAEVEDQRAGAVILDGDLVHATTARLTPEAFHVVGQLTRQVVHVTESQVLGELAVQARREDVQDLAHALEARIEHRELVIRVGDLLHRQIDQRTTDAVRDTSIGIAEDGELLV